MPSHVESTWERDEGVGVRKLWWCVRFMVFLSPVVRRSAAFLASLFVLLPSRAEALKCGKVPESGPLVAIDGEITELSLEDAGKLDDVYAIEILCWNPADSTFNHSVGLGTVYVLTKSLMMGMQDDLRLVMEAQDRFFAIHSTFSDELSELSLGEFTTEGIAIELAATEGGWSATADRGDLLYRCGVFSGSGASPHSDMTARTTKCFPGPRSKFFDMG